MATSTLNPNAPLFVPLAYRMVEDFSDEWWALVKSSPWFRDYWLQERYLDSDQDDMNEFQLYDLLPEDESSLFDVFSDHPKEEEYYSKEVIPRGVKCNKGRFVAEIPRYAEKVPKNVNVKVSPRMIHQPRNDRVKSSWFSAGGLV